jgi:hypothetical protein
MRRTGGAVLRTSVVVAVMIAGVMAPSVALAQQSVNFFLGGFVPRSLDARDPNDVLVQDASFLDFNMGDFNGFTFGGDYLIALGDKFDAGLGLSYYQRSVQAADHFSEFEGTGAPILATLKLRVVPFNATIRWLPLGHNDRGVQPYIGAGVGVFGWRYSETGNFVAADNVTIIQGNFVGSGAAVGPVILGGVRVPVGNVGIGGEIRYQSALGDLPADQGFAGSKIDLGGFSYLVTFAFKF